MSSRSVTSVEVVDRLRHRQAELRHRHGDVLIVDVQVHLDDGSTRDVGTARSRSAVDADASATTSDVLTGDVVIDRERLDASAIVRMTSTSSYARQAASRVRHRQTQPDARLLLLRSLRSARQSRSRRCIGRRSISTDDGTFGELPIPLPPLPEQRAIATALSDVDALLGGLDRLIAKKRDLKQAAMQQLLTGQTRLPGFHGEWEVKRLGDVVQCIREADVDSARSVADATSMARSSDDIGGLHGGACLPTRVELHRDSSTSVHLGIA